MEVAGRMTSVQQSTPPTSSNSPRDLTGIAEACPRPRSPGARGLGWASSTRSTLGPARCSSASSSPASSHPKSSRVYAAALVVINVVLSIELGVSLAISKRPTTTRSSASPPPSPRSPWRRALCSRASARRRHRGLPRRSAPRATGPHPGPGAQRLGHQGTINEEISPCSSCSKFQQERKLAADLVS